MTVYEHSRHLMYLCLYLRNPDINIEKIKLKEITNFINLSKEIGWGGPILEKKAVVFRIFFEYWKDQGYKVINPSQIKIPRYKEKLPKVAPIKNYKAILEDLEKSDEPNNIRNIAIIKMYYDTAIRNTELCSLNLSELNFEERRGIVENKKSRTFPYKEIYWTSGTHKSLLRWLKVRESLSSLIKDKNAVFICLDNKNFGLRIHKSGIGIMLRSLCTKLGIEVMNPHSLRHLFGVDCAKKNLNNSNISTLMGHANINYSLRYTRLHGTELKKQHVRVRT